MGRQVEFYMLKSDEQTFLETVLKANYLIVDKQASSVLMEDAINSKALSLYLIFPNSNIVIKDNGFIDAIESEAIHYSRGMSREEEKVIESSRLWAEFKYYDSNAQLTGKSKQFTDMYNYNARWIKKNYKISKCKHYYIASAAYEKYKNEGYIMKSGPKYFAEFD